LTDENKAKRMESGEAPEAGLQETIRRASTLTAHKGWLAVQAKALEGMNKLPARALALMAEGQSPEEAQLEARLEGFDVQAGAYLALVSDLPTFSAYLAYLRLLVRGERKKVERTVRIDPKPEGINEEFWDYLVSKNSKAIETVYDPLGDQITWFESAIVERYREWNAKAYRRAADLGLSSAPSSSDERTSAAPGYVESQTNSQSAKRPNVTDGVTLPLSERDSRVHVMIGSKRFKELTNAEIMKEVSIRKQLKIDFNLAPDEDAAKCCLDRIRRAHNYPLSNEVKKNRSNRN
jgi:hypothetical protein